MIKMGKNNAAKKPIPLFRPLKSRRKSRRITTTFHKLIQEKNRLLEKAAAAESGARGSVGENLKGIEDIEKEIEEMGVRVELFHILACFRVATPSPANHRPFICLPRQGRDMYQQASRVNLDIFSTTKWVIGRLGKFGMLQGELLLLRPRARALNFHSLTRSLSLSRTRAHAHVHTLFSKL